MWPYMIRLNPSGLITFCLFTFGVYLLYTVTAPSTLKRIPVVNHHQGLHHSVEEKFNGAEIHSEDEDPFRVNLKSLLIAGIRAAEAGGHKVYLIRKPSDSKNNDMKIRSKGITREGKKDWVTKGDIASHRMMVSGLSATFPGLRIISEENHTEEDEEVNLDDDNRTKDDMSGNDIVRPFHQNKNPVVYSEEITSLPNDMSVPMKHLTVWIDPLDATQEYTESYTLNNETLLTYVTTMVCVALNGNPVIGIIHKPFSHETFWVWKGRGESASVKDLVQKRKDKDISINLNLNNPNRHKETIIVSRSHAGEVDQLIHTSIPEANIIHAGGAGYKILQVLSGEADAYVHKTLIKKWDICAPQAIMDSVDGKFTTIDGEPITYNFEDDVKNEKGVLATSTYSRHHRFFNRLKLHL